MAVALKRVIQAAWKIMPRYCDALRALQKRLQQERGIRGPHVKHCETVIHLLSVVRRLAGSPQSCFN